MQFSQLFESLTEMDIAFNIPESIYAFAMPAFLGVQAGQSLNDITVFAVEFYGFDCQDKKEISDCLNKIGSPLAEDGLSYRTRAGWFNANPAVICVPDLPDFNQTGTFRAVAFAKEGFINQKTALKAVDRFKKSLQDIGAKFSSKNIVPLTRLDSTVL
jgi:hypothetical protein